MDLCYAYVRELSQVAAGLPGSNAKRYAKRVILTWPVSLKLLFIHKSGTNDYMSLLY